jgi:hypothetical protein
LLRRLEIAFEVVFAVVVVDRSGVESEVEPATELELVLVAVAVGRSGFESEVELVLAAAAVGRSGFESEVEGPVDRELLRPGRRVVAATICIAVGTLSDGLAVDSSVYTSQDTKQQPPRSPVLPPKPVQRSKYIHSQQHITILWLSVKT